MEVEIEYIDKALLKLINEENNYYKGELSIGREPVPGSSKAFYILKYRDMTLFTFWYSTEVKPPKKAGGARHTTGGKKSFTKIMDKKLVELQKEKKLTIDELGCLSGLTPYVEWGTGRVIDRTTKKSLIARDIIDKLNTTPKVFKGIVKSLKEKELLTVNKDGYFISEELFAKGAK